MTGFERWSTKRSPCRAGRRCISRRGKRWRRAETLLVDFIQRCRMQVAPLQESQSAYSLAAYLWLGHSASRDLNRIESLYQHSLDLCARHGLNEWSVKPRVDLMTFYMALR